MTATFNEADLETIKAQLVALGFLRVFVANAMKGGLSEFAQLTEKGEAGLMQILAVRSADVVNPTQKVEAVTTSPNALLEALRSRPD